MVCRDGKSENGEYKSGWTTPPMLPVMLETFPEIETGTRLCLWYNEYIFAYKDKTFAEKYVIGADSTVFDVFTIPFIRGNPKTALSKPNTIVITESIAKKYFGDEAFVLGVNFIGVGGSGKKYLPFLTFARDFSIPLFIFSDGEEKITKVLKKHYETVFGETDITKCKNITILDNTDFEGYLISSGFKTTIEAAIKELDGADAIEKWIEQKHGTSAGREKTSDPSCPTCKQPIYADVLRDYKSSDGYDQALIDILNSSKPKYAPAIAEKLCELEIEKFPPKVIDLFNKIKDGAVL